MIARSEFSKFGCTANLLKNKETFVVCIFGGQTGWIGTKTYKKGPACSNCPRKFRSTCSHSTFKNLCGKINSLRKEINLYQKQYSNLLLFSAKIRKNLKD